MRRFVWKYLWFARDVIIPEDKRRDKNTGHCYNDPVKGYTLQYTKAFITKCKPFDKIVIYYRIDFMNEQP